MSLFLCLGFVGNMGNRSNDEFVSEFETIDHGGITYNQDSRKILKASFL